MNVANRLTRTADDWLPRPVLARVRLMLSRTTAWAGPYPSWDEARRASTGYDSHEIADRALRSALTVRDGRAAYEQDTELHLAPDVPAGLALALLLARRDVEGPLRVLDFGGAFASLYFRVAPLWPQLEKMEWLVVEQAENVRRGRQHLADETLQFFESVSDAVATSGVPSLVVASAVLPYLQNPYGTLHELAGTGAPYLFLDRTQCANDGVDRCFVQHVARGLYPGSYPSWFLSWDRLCAALEPTYGLLYRFPAAGGAITGGGQHTAEFRGGLWHAPRTRL